MKNITSNSLLTLVVLLFILFFSENFRTANAQGAYYKGCMKHKQKNCGDAPLNTYPYCNWTLPVNVRVQDLINRMTTAELISQMGNQAPGIPRLGISCYDWWNEASHGVSTDCGTNCPTSFPAVVALGATFDIPLVNQIAQAISDEARALWAEGIGGLNFWAPNMNIARDPRWGRNQEVASEDPYLMSQYVTAFVKGLQEGSDPNYVKVIATCKHYLGYSLDNWKGISRHEFDATLSEYDLVETYLPAFRACVQGGQARSVMCSYNSVNGVPACANTRFLQNVLRNRFGFQGYVVSDCDAIEDIVTTHHYLGTPQDACAASVHAGTDLNCGSYYQDYLSDSLQAGGVTEDDLKQAVSRTYTQLFEVGMFDPDFVQPYTQLPKSTVDSLKNSDLALKAAREAIVLLKNDGNFLPLSKNANFKIAVIGPNADVRETLLSNYHGERCKDGDFDCVMSPYEGIRTKIPDDLLSYAKGCDIDDDSDNFDKAIRVAQRADIIIAFMGLDSSVEDEELDRESISLPGVQEDLLKELSALGKPIILVLINGGTISIEWSKGNIPAIIEAWYGGQNGALAIADVIFGDYTPGGRLPVTVYPAEYVNQVDMTDMNMLPDDFSGAPGRTYKYYGGTPLWPFGFGLSYTTFRMSWSMPPPSVVTTNSSSFTFSVAVTNIGSYVGDQVVLAFVVPVNGTAGPLRRLFAFERVHDLPPGATQVVSLNCPGEAFSFPTGVRLQRVIDVGSFVIEVGVMDYERIAWPIQIQGNFVLLG